MVCVSPLKVTIGAKLAVAPVARATPLFLPRPEIIYTREMSAFGRLSLALQVSIHPSDRAAKIPKKIL